MIYGYNEETSSKPILINGGYFENPFYQGEEYRREDGSLGWKYQGSENNCKPFNFDQRLIVKGNYKWSGLETHGIPQSKEQIEFSPSIYDNNFINFGEFGDNNVATYEDHFLTVPSNYTDIINNESIIQNVLQQFFSINLLENPELAETEFEVIEASYEDM